MARVPCIVCPNCGLHSGIAEKTCLCGAALDRRMARLVEEAEAKPRGRWDPKTPVYVQKCSNCGTLNFTTEEESPVRQCWKCHKARVASVARALYEDEEARRREEQAEESGPEGDPKEASGWEQLARGVTAAVSGLSDAPAEEPREEKEGTGEPDYQVPEVEDPPTDDSDPEEVIDWDQVFKEDTGSAEGEGEKPGKSTLTLTALRYGKCELTLTSDQKDLPCQLGRSAVLADFLALDRRVGNRHCRIHYDGGWVVTDTNSLNGVGVNDRILDINASSPLRDGDTLILGHHRDSMAFRVTIRE